MKIEIIEEKENKLLNRKEYKVKISEFNETPSRQQVLSAFTAKAGADLNKTVIDRIDQCFGKPECYAYIKVYETEESLKIENEHKIKRTKGEETEEKESQTQQPEQQTEEKAGDEK